MMIKQNILVKIGGKNIKHYRSLGYDIKLYDQIEVPVEHLSDGSHYKVLIQCDYCERTFLKTYKSLLLERKKSYGEKDCCENCIHIKTKETMINKYNVENCMSLDSTVEKLENTFMQKYGVQWNMMNEEIKNKA